MELVHKYAHPETIARAFEMAWTRAQLVFRFLGIGPGAAHRYQELASQLIYPNPRLRPSPDRISRNRLGQETLWAYSISGDLPMVVITIGDLRNMPLMRDVLLAAQADGFSLAGLIRSPLKGPAGNIEFLAYLRLGVAPVDFDVEAAIFAAMPTEDELLLIEVPIETE